MDGKCPVYEYGKAEWRTFDQGASKEWLLTNGIGGFASSTIIGANTRRYHGLLVAALDAPAKRRLVLAKLDECLTVIPTCGGSAAEYKLYAYKTSNSTLEGYQYLQRFVFEPLPQFSYFVDGVFIEKTVSMVYGKNTCVVVYRISNGQDRTVFKISPLVNFRDYHHITRKSTGAFVQTVPGNAEAGCVEVQPYGLDCRIKLFCGGSVYTPSRGNWFTDMYYPEEAGRGLEAYEDHYVPGSFKVELEPGEKKTISFIASIEDEFDLSDGLTDGPSLQKAEIERLDSLTKNSVSDNGADWFIGSLCRAADSFIVKRAATGMRTILAGYPWFMDWGRDAMISLPGLTLVTGRFDVAREVLLTFSQKMKNGLIPNLFPDDGGEPAYNTADASLWFIEAAGRYASYSGDYDFIRENLYYKIREIIESYAIGTDYGIGMDYEGLLDAGDEYTQLTWMDTKVRGSAVTPRHGKAVELNALWYNALMTASGLAARFGEDDTAEVYKGIAGKLKDAFARRFWNEDAQCLYDVITKHHKDASVRPNQILAISLTHSVIIGDMAKKVLQKVYKELYATYGLRTLSRDDASYNGIYTGDQDTRDRAYHNGTAWTWLMGHFITAWSKVFENGTQTADILRMFIRPFIDHIRDAGIGTISEIFDGDTPNKPRGCTSQAWSVAELLRVCAEHNLA